MLTNFDEMDIEPKSDPSVDPIASPTLVDSSSKNDTLNEEELQSQLLLRTVPLDDGSIGYVFTCTKNGPLETWRCHACNYVDTWRSLLKHVESKWHKETMSKYKHSRSNFVKIENEMPPHTNVTDTERKCFSIDEDTEFEYTANMPCQQFNATHKKCDSPKNSVDRVEKKQKKINIKTKSKSHLNIIGHSTNVFTAKQRGMPALDAVSTKIKMKLSVSYIYQAHVNGKNGSQLRQVMRQTNCHINCPDLNKSSQAEICNQFSITGEIASLERGRARIRELIPLVFCIQLSDIEITKSLPILSSLFVLGLQKQYNVEVSYRPKAALNPTRVVVKGTELNVTQVKEATSRFLNNICDSSTSQVSVLMELEIPPRSHSLILGYREQNVESIMHHSGARIRFADSDHPCGRSAVENRIIITGTIDGAYSARQMLTGLLPIILMFSVRTKTNLSNAQFLKKIMRDLDVHITAKPMSSQNLYSVVIEGFEKNATNIYQAYQKLTGSHEEATSTNIIAEIPKTYYINSCTPTFLESFSKTAIPDISKGQPLPPGMEDEIAGPCQILKTLEVFDQPLIGLEFLLELNMADMKEPRYLCLLCDKRGDPRSILVHLTSQSHYLQYLRKYFRKFYALIDKLPKSNECRGNVSTVTAHLIAKLEEKYGRLQPTSTREDVVNIPQQRSIILQRIDNSVHFSESAEDAYLEDMLTVEYVQNTTLLLKKFPLKPKHVIDEKIDDTNFKSLFNKSSKSVYKKQLRNRDQERTEREESPEVVFVSSAKAPQHKSDRRGNSREKSPRSHSRHRSRTPDRGRRRYISPSYYRSLRYRNSRSRSPRRHLSRSPMYEREREKYIRRPSPHPKYGSSRPSYRHRTPERHSRRSPSPSLTNTYSSKYTRGRSRSRSYKSKERSSPYYKSRKSRSRSISRSRHSPEIRAKSTAPGPNHKSNSTNKEKEKFDGANKFAYIRELKEVEEKLNKDMVRYSETPEDHPSYQDEWKKFWSAKFKELQSEGKCDPHTYDYKPEWISFWHVRVKELHEEELNLRKNSLKAKYGLSDEDKESKAPKRDDSAKSSASSEEEKKPVVDIKTMWKELTGFEIREEPTKRKSLSPWEDNDNDSDKSSELSKNEPPPKKHQNNKNSILDDAGTQPISPEPLSPISDDESGGRSPVFRSRSRSYSRSRSRSHSKPRSYSKERGYKEDYRKPSKKIHFENPLNIITVLRQLSVLEFQLGSYANHVINLLSSGLAMEKIKPQSSVDILTKENVIFLELVKEKLKGQLLAGVVQKSMVKATLFCIKNIEELLLLVPKLKPTAPPPVPAPPPGLLYGAGVESMAGASLPYGAHVYGAYPMAPAGGYKPMPPNYKRYEKYKDHYPFRQALPQELPIKRPIEHVRVRSPDRYPFRKTSTVEEAIKEKPVVPSVEEEIPIDKKLIAIQIAEVLTAQGRSDVSNEELQTLINIVVDNLKQEQRNKVLVKEAQSVKETNVPAMPVSSAPVSTPGTFDGVTIPAGFNLNDVSNSTLALLADAFSNVSSQNANKPFSIETLPESELIQLLRNFKNIPRMKQEKLIEYLRKLEDSNPERVEELKKYVNVM